MSARAIVLSAALLLSACGPSDGTGPVGPALEVAPTALDWGSIPAAEAGARTLELRSVGDDVLRIDGAALADGSFVLLGIDPSGARLSPGEAMSLSIAPSARRDGLLASVLSVSSSGGDLDVPLTADLRAPILEVAPGAWDFGTRNVLCPTERELVVENLGRSPLRWEAVSIDEGSGGADWWLEDAPEPGSELAPDGSLRFTVGFEARDPEPADAVVLLVTNDPERGELEVPVSGRGRLGPEATETFPVPAEDDGIFELASPAAPFTVQVRVDGALTFQGWRHDEELGAVVFEAAFRPAAGSTVRISYRRGGC